MTATEEQQMLTSLAEISEHLKGLLAFTREQARAQETVTEKTLQYLNNIAHKR